jgi:hypothetical protein
MKIKLMTTRGDRDSGAGIRGLRGRRRLDRGELADLHGRRVTDCLEGAGQKVRKVEVSFAKIPPDLGVSSQAGGANIWITDDTQAVVDQTEELAKLDEAESLIPIEDRVVQSGNLIAVVDSDASPDYRATIEGCIPPA